MGVPGNIIMLMLSWLLLRYRGQSLAALFGSDFLYRFLQLIAGFVCSAFLAGMISMLFSVIANFSWQPAQGVDIVFILNRFFQALSHVLFQELLFRGVLLYLAINFIGEQKANLLSALAYGVYYWFVLQVWGNPIIMLWALVYIGLWGLMLAYAYSRTGSLALPIGLHLGWNFVDQHIFNRLGDSVFSISATVHTQYLSTLEEMLYLRMPVLAFAVIMIVLLCQYFPVKVYANPTRLSN